MPPSLVMTRRWLQLMLGLFLYGFAISMMIRAAIGLSPWTVLAQGISLRIGIPFGIVTNLISGVVLLLWIPLRQRIRLGTVINALLIGPSAEVGLWLIPLQEELWLSILLFVAGLLLLAVATGLYIGARFGPGARDGLMTGLNRKFGVRIWIARVLIETIVLAIGWILGGNVGIGTLAFALFIGPLVHLTMPILKVPETPSGPSSAASPAENR